MNREFKACLIQHLSLSLSVETEFFSLMHPMNSNDTHQSKIMNFIVPDSTFVHGLAIALENATTCVESGKFWTRTNSLLEIRSIWFPTNFPNKILIKFKQTLMKFVSTTVLTVITKCLATACQTFQLQAFTI